MTMTAVYDPNGNFLAAFSRPEEAYWDTDPFLPEIVVSRASESHLEVFCVDCGGRVERDDRARCIPCEIEAAWEARGQ